MLLTVALATVLSAPARAHTDPVKWTIDRCGVGFSASAKINRLDYGVKWNRLIEGTNMLGDDVEITINIEATRA